MRVSSFLSSIGGLVAVAHASPHLLGGLDGLTSKQSSVAPSSCSLANSWEDHTLFLGIAAPETQTSAAISLGLHLPKAQISGDVQLELVKDFLSEPKVRVGLGGIKAYVELDISASAAVHEAIELFASAELELEIPGLLEAEAGAAVALDLVVGVDAAIILSTGVYISFGEDAFVEISLLTKDIVDVSLDGLVAKALPFGIGAEVDLSAEVALQLGLRLRTEIDLEAELDIPILDIEAGSKVAIWVSLFDYTAVLVGTDDCVVSISELIAITLGLAVELNVEVGDILDLSLAPTLTIILAKAADSRLCVDSRGTPGIFLETIGASDSSHDSDGASSSAGTKTVLLAAVSTITSSGEAATTFGPVVTSPAANGTSSAIAPRGSVTRTVTSAHTYTITSCAASVVNCPARYTQKVVTSTVVSTTYNVCPASENGAITTSTVASESTPTSVPFTIITESLTTIVPCSERSTSTFHAPTNSPPPAPTVTIVNSTAATWATEKTAESTAAPSTSSSFQVVTTPATYEAAWSPSSYSTPGAGESSLPASVETAPFPAHNGTIPTSKPVVPGVPAPSGYFTTPVYTPSAVVSAPAAASTPAVVSTPSSVAVSPAPVTGSGNMVVVAL